MKAEDVDRGKQRGLSIFVSVLTATYYVSTLRTQPVKAVSRSVLRDGHLNRVHFAGHIAFLQKNEGGKVWAMENKEAYRFLLLCSLQHTYYVSTLGRELGGK